MKWCLSPGGLSIKYAAEEIQEFASSFFLYGCLGECEGKIVLKSHLFSFSFFRII